MTNNDILRRLRYSFNFNDDKMIKLFKLGGLELSRSAVINFLKKDDQEDYAQLFDKELAIFLNGFIIERRGKNGDEIPKPEKRLNNNIILRKLKIALELKDTDVLEILLLVDMQVSKTELSALFRKADHPHYRKCKDQFLRNFLHGLQIKYHDFKM